MTKLVFSRKFLIEPLEVEMIVENIETNKMLSGSFKMKHTRDWVEAGVVEFSRLGSKLAQKESLLGLKKVDPKDVALQQELMRIISALSNIMKEYALLGDSAEPIWNNLSLSEKAEIIRGFMEWVKEQSEEED